MRSQAQRGKGGEEIGRETNSQGHSQLKQDHHLCLVRTYFRLFQGLPELTAAIPSPTIQPSGRASPFSHVLVQVEGTDTTAPKILGLPRKACQCQPTQTRLLWCNQAVFAIQNWRLHLVARVQIFCFTALLGSKYRS